MQVQITLSRAHKIAERIKDMMREKDALLGSVFSNMYLTGIAGKSQKADWERKFKEGKMALAMYQNYNEVLTQVRMVIGRANVTFGISDLLAEQEKLSRWNGVLKEILKKDGDPIIPSDLEDYKPFSSDSSPRSHVEVTLIDPELRAELTGVMEENKKRIFAISNRIADTNVNKITLEISDEMVKELGLA